MVYIKKTIDKYFNVPFSKYKFLHFICLICHQKFAMRSYFYRHEHNLHSYFNFFLAFTFSHIIINISLDDKRIYIQCK